MRTSFVSDGGFWPSRFSEVARLLRTARHIPVRQLAARARFVALRQLYAASPRRPISAAGGLAAHVVAAEPLPRLPRALIAPEGMSAVEARALALTRGRFGYVGREMEFSGGIRWSGPHPSPLWAYQLHSLASVLDLTLVGRTDRASEILASWIAAYGMRWDALAWHPYPVSLRLANLCLAAGRPGTFDVLGPQALAIVAAHAAYLLRHLEWDVRGNHLLENARALLLAGRFLRGPLAVRCEEIARGVLAAEVPDQVLPDGAHFELSPMYHAIVLHRLLEAAALLGYADPLVRAVVGPAVVRMARFLRGILCPDDGIPLLGDSVRGFGPPPAALLRLARRLSPRACVEPRAGLMSFSDSGLHVWRGRGLWAILDAGPVCPDYLPAHGQADSLTMEVWCRGACVVGDPGVYEYTGPERAWGRSSRAHSTVTVDDLDTSEVYASFRVGGRARISRVKADGDTVTAVLEPYGVDAHWTRTVRFAESGSGSLQIVDSAVVSTGRTARSRLHLHPAVTIVEQSGTSLILGTPAGPVRVQARHPLRVEPGRSSRQFGRIEPSLVVVQDLRPARVDDGDRVVADFVLEVS